MDLYKFRLPNESNSVIAKNVEDIRMIEGGDYYKNEAENIAYN